MLRKQGTMPKSWSQNSFCLSAYVKVAEKKSSWSSKHKLNNLLYLLSMTPCSRMGGLKQSQSHPLPSEKYHNVSNITHSSFHSFFDLSLNSIAGQKTASRLKKRLCSHGYAMSGRTKGKKCNPRHSTIDFIPCGVSWWCLGGLVDSHTNLLMISILGGIMLTSKPRLTIFPKLLERNNSSEEQMWCSAILYAS